MFRNFVHLFLAISLALPVATGLFGFSGTAGGFPLMRPSQITFEAPCTMDHCSPFAPKCPLCPSWSGTNLFLFHESADDLPPPAPGVLTLTSNTLSDQGVVRTIFHPPMFLL
jgi:hypothetical protein